MLLPALANDFDYPIYFSDYKQNSINIALKKKTL